MKKIKFIAVALAVFFVFNTYAIPRSKAVVIDATAAFGAAAATAAINGTTATTLFTGMSTGAATTAMTSLMGEYAAATGVAASGAALASTIATGILVTGGVLLVGAAAAALIGGFIDWLRDEKGLKAGGNSLVVFSDNMFLLQDGTIAFVFRDESSAVSGSKYSIGSGDIVFSTGLRWTFPKSDPGYFYGIKPDGANMFRFNAQSFIDKGAISFNAYYGLIKDLPDPNYRSLTFVFYDSNNSIVGIQEITQTALYFQGQYGYVSTDISLDPKPEFQVIPQELPSGHVLKIDTGLEILPSDDQQAAADSIIQSAIDGHLNPTVSVENDPTVIPDPDPGPDPDPVPPPGDLPQNLPELGDVLISRFPFSIPWDIGRVLDFLSADPVAPHIEFQPFKGGLFGIPAGSVSVEYDFSKHEDIAAFCRTFEIVGFCLLLAVGTKRLIWTA